MRETLHDAVMPTQEKRKQEPPDGGWGWLVVLGSCLIYLFTRSIDPSFGLLFGDVLQDLHIATTGAAFIMSARDTINNFSGILMGPLLKNFSYRQVGVMGAILSGVGLMATATARSMTHIMLTYSFIGGLGLGMSSTAAFIALNSYFVKRRGQAFGLAMAGTALGFMLMPQIVSRLLEEFGFDSTVLLMGALCLNALVGASLLQPVKRHLKTIVEPDKFDSIVSEEKRTLQGNKIRDEAEEENSKYESSKFSKSPLQAEISPHTRCSLASLSCLDLTDSLLDVPKACHHNSYHSINNNEEDNVSEFKKNYEESNKSEKGFWAKLSSFMDFDLLLDLTFVNTLFGLSLAYLAEINFKLIIPFFMANLGYSKRETAQALSLMAIADISARLLIPPIFDRLSFSPRKTLSFGLVFVMIARSVLAEQTSWRNLIVTILIHGFFRGFTLINFPLVISESVVREKLPSAHGLYMVSKGLFVVFLGPLLGWFRDYTESYSLCLHAQSVMIMVCVVSWNIEYWLCSKSNKSHSKIKEPS